MQTIKFTNDCAFINLTRRAAEKARDVKPKVVATSVFGKYIVNDKYIVYCRPDRTITCNCAATEPCYHIAATVWVHLQVARVRAEQQEKGA